MNKIISIAILSVLATSCGTTSQNVSATTSAAASKKCKDLAATATMSKFGSYFYKGGHKIREVFNTTCEITISTSGNKYMRCEVSAIGDDIGSVDFTALLNAECSRAFGIFVSGEE